MRDDPREDSLHALREILQELALLGLWRSRFFEHAVFFGGAALRVLHGLDRFFADRDRMSYPHCTHPCRSRPRASAAWAASAEKRISLIPLSTVFR